MSIDIHEALHETQLELHRKLESKLEELGEETIKELVAQGWQIEYGYRMDDEGWHMIAELKKPPEENK